MNFRTTVNIDKPDFDIKHQNKMMLFGSCFSQNIGDKLEENKFDVNANPFGILYNPMSISANVRRLINNEGFDENDIAKHNGIYHSFMHHGKFSDTNKDVCIQNIQQSFDKSRLYIAKADIMLITFGTAYIYKLVDSDEVVANCHKLPTNRFKRERLTANQITIDWTNLIEDIKEINPDIKFIFTVSPIRHWKDGAHENNISKSILHLAIDDLKNMYPNCVTYFPAYEIVIDELRDYRFYADDMIHASPIAIDYIWERFGNTFFSKETNDINSEWKRIYQSINHRPINPNTDNHNKFLKQTLSRVSDFKSKYPYINLENEINNITERIAQWNIQ